VFLTDTDLGFMEQHQARLALVLAGTRAGFFVCEPDGSIQAVRSHEEFSFTDPAGPAPARRVPRRPRARWIAASAAVLGVPAAALACFQALLPSPPLAIHLREQAGQLLIAWEPRAVQEPARLEIVDGGTSTIVVLSKGTASATYQPAGRLAGRGVLVRLAAGTRGGAARYLRPEP
jgi:hypothetical protein